MGKSMKSAPLLVAAALLGAAGCGSSGGNPSNLVQVTYSYAAGQPITVAGGACEGVVGPVTLHGDGKMYYQVQDDSGTDTMTLAILPYSFFASESCNFTTDQTLVDVPITGSAMDTVDAIADTYELVVACTLPTNYNCVFHLTWNATY
jgi:hypothetical protein